MATPTISGTDASPTTLSDPAYSSLSPSVLANPSLYCTLSTCPISLAQSRYVPSLPGNAFYVGLFGLFLISQLYFGLRYRTWGFLAGMFCGIVLEIIGYSGRIQMHYNPFKRDPFLTYLTTLTIAPAFLAASIYLTLARIVPVYSLTLSRFKPRTYTLLFVTFDIIALLLQAAGGIIASSNDTDRDTIQTGIDVMVAGVSWQVFSIGAFALLCLEFAWRVHRAPEDSLSHEAEFVELRRTRRFRFFLWSVAGATMAVFVRSVFRCAELREGFDGELANQEVPFMILEGAMIIIAVGLLTVSHPGSAFKGRWGAAGWNFRTGKADAKTGQNLPGEAEKITA